MASTCITSLNWAAGAGGTLFHRKLLQSRDAPEPPSPVFIAPAHRRCNARRKLRCRSLRNSLSLHTYAPPSPGGSTRPWAVHGGGRAGVAPASVPESGWWHRRRRPGGGERKRGPVQAVQGMDYTAVCAACHDLRAWVPAKIDRVVQPDKHTLALGIRTLHATAWLYLCWHPVTAHLAVGSAPPSLDSTSAALSFGDQLGYLLRNLAIVEVVVPGAWERVAQLRLGVRPGDPPTRDIYVEVMGRYSNVVLVDSAAAEILACAYQVGSRMTSVRTLQVGGKYQLPPPAPGTSPDGLSSSWVEWRSVIRAAFQDKLAQALVQAFRGVSPALARELMGEAGLHLETKVDEVSEEQWLSLHSAWQDWLACLSAQQFKPGIVRASSGYTVLGGDEPYVQCDGKPADNVLSMIFDYYSNIYWEEKFQQLKHQLGAKLNAAMKKVQAKVTTYSEQMEAAKSFGDIVKKGDLLMANLHLCEKNASSVEVLDFETGEPVVLSLDPLQPAIATAQKLYKRSQKMKRSAGAIAPLLRDASDELAYLTQVEVSLLQLERYETPLDFKALEEIRDELIEQGYMKPLAAVEPAKGRQQKKKKQSLLETVVSGMRQYVSPSGYQVLAGKNNKQNDLLTNRVATDYDIWFHARNVAGCHLLLRVPPGQVPADEDLQFSADIAAYFSKARGSGKAEVSYTSPKHLKKVKGMKPGQVLVEKETVILGKEPGPDVIVTTSR